MDAKQMLRLKPKLAKFLSRFDDCFGRKDSRAHLPVYVQGQLSDLPDKSVEPIATKAGVAPRTLQEFLTQLKWDQERLRDQVQEIVRRDQSGPHSIGIIDETSFAKQGDKTPGVQRQWCGSEGKKENCLVTVHLGYARADFHCLLDGEVFLPESWSADRERCREAGIPDNVVYRPKWVIALELYDHAIGNGLEFDWLTFDEGYGGKPDFLRGLSARQQSFVGEVPRSFTGWLKGPRVTTRPFHRRRGRGRRTPRLVSGSRPAQSVAAMLDSRVLRAQPWQRWRVKDGEKGPMVWEVKHTLFYAKDADGLPGQRLHLVVARNVLKPEEIKFFVSNAPPETTVQRLLLVAFSRWRVERCFADQKGEVGLDHYEGRRYLGLKRHLVLSAVSYLFLAQTRQELVGEKTGADGMPAQHGAGCTDPVLVA
ncbi:MAG TPA: IS701 family transposase [Alphaproteobacteria bacterium]|nr:IS701 family transposase [Alphaproteobacteria bacterium]